MGDVAAALPEPVPRPPPITREYSRRWSFGSRHDPDVTPIPPPGEEPSDGLDEPILPPSPPPAQPARPVGDEAALEEIEVTAPRREAEPTPTEVKPLRPEDLRPCPPKKKPLKVGSNGKVGSGARTRQKVVGTALAWRGLRAAAAAAAAAAERRAELRSQGKGPEQEMTAFTDAASGVALEVAAKRAGDPCSILGVDRRGPRHLPRPHLEDPAGGEEPARGICDPGANGSLPCRGPRHLGEGRWSTASPAAGRARAR